MHQVLLLQRRETILKTDGLERRKNLSSKLHIAVDALSKKVLCFRITKGNVHDSKKFCPMIKEVSQKYNIDQIYDDKTHDIIGETLTC